jgi:hypothetical protein
MAYMGRSPTIFGSRVVGVFRKRMEKLDEKRLATQVRRCILRPFDLLYANLLQRTWQSGEGLDRTPYAAAMEQRFANGVHDIKRAVSIAQWSLFRDPRLTYTSDLVTATL